MWTADLASLAELLPILDVHLRLSARRKTPIAVGGISLGSVNGGDFGRIRRIAPTSNGTGSRLDVDSRPQTLRSLGESNSAAGTASKLRDSVAGAVGFGVVSGSRTPAIVRGFFDGRSPVPSKLHFETIRIGGCSTGLFVAADGRIGAVAGLLCRLLRHGFSDPGKMGL